MLRDHDIVCLSITPWETTLPSSGHYLMREFARHNRVLFVDHPLTLKDCWTQRRDPSSRERLMRTFGRAPTLRRVPDAEREIWVLTPPPILPNGLPTALFEAGLKAASVMVARSIRSAMQRLGMRDVLYWVSFDVPLGTRLIGKLGERMVIYHCFDEIAGEPYIARHGARLEPELMRKSEVVFTTSCMLQKARQEQHPRVHFVPNGVDFAHYARALDPHTRVPDDLAALPRPVIGYLGNFESRIDFELLDQLAAARPDWSLALIGPSKGKYTQKLRTLERHPNVHVLGPRSVSEAPGYLKGFDVALIPFVLSDQTRAIYPLKINEYLAAGRPVVMTPFAPLPEFAAVSWIADGVYDTVSAIEEALGRRDPGSVSARMELARSNDWDARAQAMGRLLVERLIAQNAQMVSGGSSR